MISKRRIPETGTILLIFDYFFDMMKRKFIRGIT